MKHRAEKYLKKLRNNEISGLEFCHAFSKRMDKDLRLKAAEVLPQNVAVVAIGGYGRSELCPYSDIDILFLVPQKISKKLETAIEKILYHFWDSGQKMGHAVRTVHECLAVMNSDPRVLTSLMDARLIWGDKNLYEELQKEILSARKPKKISQFVKAKLAERDKRHERYQDSRYVLEPNIKDGKGGLRDYQTLFWITGQVYNAPTPETLAATKILTRREHKRFEKAHDFLLTVRCHLHDIAGRAEERLHFDIQPELATRLGYTHRNNARAVERFMKHYFLVTRDIGDMTRVVCAAIEENENEKTKWLAHSTQNYMGFEITNNRLNFSQSHNLEEQPSEIMRFFRIAQEKECDIHPEALRRIAKNIHLIDQKFNNNALTNKLFLEILTGEHNAALMLRRMNEAGVLERFIPEFRKVIALMQFDRYHVFTVDEHTLRAIDILHQIENGALRSEAGLASALIHTIEHRNVLYVAMLLHDICKGRGGDHSELGAELALAICPRLGLTDQETRLVAWLVFDHLFMSEIAFKRDLQDPQTIEDFLFRMHGLERLKLLTILTTADIMAVGPGRWTSWKDKLISELYYMAEARFSGKHPLISTAGLSAVPYDLGHDETRISFSMDDEKNATEVSIFTQDRPALFATLAGALSAAGANIIEARINTLDDGRIADIFTVQNFSGKPIITAKRQSDIKDSVLKALAGELDVKKSLAARLKKPAKKDLAFDIPTGVIIKPKASRRFNVIEAYGRDRPGLLYDLAHIISQHGFVIKSAKINTLGLKAIDIFYINDQKGKKVTDTATLEKLQKALQKTLKA